MQKVIECKDERETAEFGRLLAGELAPGAVIALDGALGCGKTALTRAIARGLGIKEPVVSPTFTIMREYTDGRLPLYHFDVYRISEPDEMYELGYEEYFYGEGITVVEWAERVSDLIPDDAVHIRIEKDAGQGFDYRRITVMSEGELPV